MIIITKTVARVKKGCGYMHYPLFEELKKLYVAHPEKLDSLTREEFENMVSCEKEAKNYDNYFRFIYCSSNRSTLHV